MTEKFYVREANPSDAEAIGILYQVLMGRECCVLPERIAQIAADPNNFLFVVEAGTSVLGTAFLTLCPDPMYGQQPFAVVENISVAESHRRKGAGTTLLRFVERACVQADCSKIMLLSSSERFGAHAFFRLLGYLSDAKVGFVKYRSGLSVQ